MAAPMDPDVNELLGWLLDLQGRIQRQLVGATRREAGERLARVARESAGDTLYEIDCAVDELVMAACRELGARTPFALIAEGCTCTFPAGTAEDDARFRLIMDPLDGTRGIMYDKRSAWTLSAVAPNRGPGTTLADIVLAVQTEIPTSKQYLADTLWATPGGGAQALRRNLLSGEARPFTPRPSAATDLQHGFAMLSKFFPGRKAVVAEIEERLFGQLEGLVPEDRARVFDDEYISTGGQLYELAVGHDRLNGDLRAALMGAGHLPGYPPGLAVHAYDICTELIAREAGVVVTDLRGGPLRAGLAEDENVAWLAYANRELQARVEPVLQGLLSTYGLI